MFRTALMLFMSSLAIPAVASMRCGTHLVDEGDSVEQVLERCGQPLSRIGNEPALRNNGVPKLNAARTEFWVYGPSGGVYRRLRFIDGKLVWIINRIGKDELIVPIHAQQRIITTFAMDNVIAITSDY